MAKSDGSVVIDTKLNTGGFSSGAKDINGQFKKLASSTKKAAGKIAKVGATVAVAAGGAAVAVTKQAISAYADYEQIVGGVETLFKGASETVIKNAENAFYTVGMSANEYMETVTSFSASLISSLGGDTAKAASVADMALVDMADNANKMGTSLEAVKTAYQGFAKQQYMLLDNLKLGYGGTKTEMERLLKDAEKLTGEKYDIDNLGDVYSAIHAIQVELGIAGTTANEAEKTITGAANMTKAAWQNVLTAIAGGGDLGKAIDNFVFSISQLFKNLVPVVEKAIAGLGTLIEQAGPALVETVVAALIRAIPSLVSAVYKMIISLAKGIYSGIASLLTGATKEVEKQLNDTKSLSGGLDSAAESAANLAEETENSADAAKKAVAGFDELNVLSSGSGEDSAAALAATPSAGGAISLPMSVDVTDNASNKMAEIAGKIKSVFEQIKNDITTKYAPTISSWGDAFKNLSPSIENASSKIKNSLSGLWNNSLKPFAQNITEDFIPSVVNKFSETFAPIFSDVMPVAIDEFAKDFERNTTLVNEACDLLQLGFDKVKMVFSDMCDSIKTNWDTYGGSILQGFVDFKDGLWETFWSVYNDVVKPIIDNCAQMFEWLWTDHLKPLWDSIVDFFMSIVDNALALWNGLLKPLIDWIWAGIGPLVTNVINGIVDGVVLLVAWVADAVKGIIKNLNGIITFLVGIFTLDFKRAWEGIKKIFEGVWDGIKTVFTATINGIIWVLNQMIALVYSGFASFINKLGFVVEKIGGVFGKEWGFSIPTEAPKIPYLAKGAVIPPNAPFMAVLGDQKHGTNIEAPLDTIKQALADVMSMQGGGETNVNVTFTGDLAQLARVLKPAIETETRRRGGSLAKGATF